MARSPRAKKTGDPHDWNPLENYVFLHDKHLNEHPLVLPDSELRVTFIENQSGPHDLIVMEGEIYCANGICLEIKKVGDVERSSAQRVRMWLYRYNASLPGVGNVLRYDNQHRSNNNVYHRHVFDIRTGEQTDYRELTRQEFPVMHQILDELSQLLPTKN